MDAPDSARKITLVTATAIVVASMIGTGVFTSLGFQLIGIKTGFPILLLWILGGVVSLCGALCYAELGAMMPRSGGEYHFLQESFHPLIGFLAGWTSIVAGFAAPVAVAAVAFGKYGSSITGINGTVLGILVVLLVTRVHLGNITFTGRFQSWLTIGKVILVFVVIFAAFVFAKPQPFRFTFQSGDMDQITSGAFATSLVYVMYSYTGWNGAAYVAGEIENPQRNLPLALTVGTVLVALLYVGLNAAFLYATPIDSMVSQLDVGLIAGKQIFGTAGGTVVGILIAFGLVSMVSSMTFTGPRVTAMIGEDYSLFEWLAVRNRFGVPAWGILAQAVLAIILILTASFEQLINYVQAILLISSLLTVLGVVVLRITRPDDPRPFRVPFVYTPVFIFSLMTIYILYFLVREKPGEVIWGVATLLIGIGIYFVSRNSSKK